MKKILMLIHTFPPIGSVGGSIRIVKFLKYLNELKSDYHSTIITIRDDIDLLNDMKLSEVSISEIPTENVDIIKTNTFQPRHPNAKADKKQNSISNSKELRNKTSSIKLIIKKIYTFLENTVLIPDYGVLWIPFSLKAALKEIKNTKFDIIYATGPPFSVLFQGAILKRITKIKLVIDIKDDWIYQTKFLSKNKLVRIVESKMEQFCIRSSDKIILVTKKSYDDHVERFPQIKDRFQLIPNGCDVVEYEKYWDQEKRENSKFTIIHAGVIAQSRNPSGFFKAVSQLVSENIISKDNFNITFIGSLHKDFIDVIDEMNISDLVNISGLLEREDYILNICNADLLLVFNYQLKTLVPGKLYDYWGGRRPILLVDSADSMAAQIVNENKLGSVVDFEDVDGMKRVIKDQFEKWKKGKPSEQTDITNLYNYDRKNLTKKLIETLDTV